MTETTLSPAAREALDRLREIGGTCHWHVLTSRMGAAVDAELIPAGLVRDVGAGWVSLTAAGQEAR